MADTHDWEGRVGEVWANEWRRTDRSFSGLTDRLLERTRDFSFENVLDVGCGAGELSLALARGRRGSEVLGLDISTQLILAAQQRGEHRENVSFELGDASIWTGKPGFSPDLLVSRHGVMFFSDPVSAFANLAARASDNAGLMFSCFRSPVNNPFFSQVTKLLPTPSHKPDPFAPGPFAFADQTRVAKILEDAGWRDIAFEPFDFAMIAGAGPNPIDEALAYYTHIGPAAAAARDMTIAEREILFAGLKKVASDHCIGGVVALEAATWIVSARKA